MGSQYRDARSRVVPALCAVAALCATVETGYAQDRFEIHVLEYETRSLGSFTFETHLNDSVSAKTAHITAELTAGVASQFSIGVMQLNTHLASDSLENAGWRLVPHFYAPENWHLPVAIGITAELSFPHGSASKEPRTMELIGIIEKRFGRWKLDANPSLLGPFTDSASRGWEFGFAARIGYESRRRFIPTLEYYGDYGDLFTFEPFRYQSRQIYPGGDIRLTDRLLISTVLGFGLTPASETLTLKMRVEFDLGRRGGP